MNFSQSKEEIFSLLDSASFITMVGTTGSGKSQFLFSYYDRTLPQYKPYEIGIRAFDVVRVDYFWAAPRTLLGAAH